MSEFEKTLKEKFKLSYLMPSQEAVITRIVENSLLKESCDSITILPTGAGKSLIFMLPSFIFKDRYNILLYPLLSLMNDQAKRLKELNIPYAVLKGGMEKEERKKALESLRKMEANILITNIESLIVSLERNELSFMKNNIELFVIDEAHTAVTWAQSFRPSFLELNRVMKALSPHQRLCFTATADDEIIEKLVKNVLENPKTEIMRLSADRSNIFYSSLRSLNKKEDVRYILYGNSMRPALVFCSYRNETAEYYEYFKNTFHSFFYHAGLDKTEKERIEKEFHQSKDGVMFSTNAYGMGVDKKDIRTVIHLHAPDDAASFLQEAGRGGRDNKDMNSIVLYDERDKGKLKYVFSSNSCIRHMLLSLLGEKSDSYCLSCSNCIKKHTVAAGEKEIMLVKKLPFLFTKKTLTKLLSIFALRRWSDYDINRAIETLIKEEKIKRLFSRLY